MERAIAAVVLAALSLSLNLCAGGCRERVVTCNLPLGIPSGFAQRDAGRLGGRHTSPAAQSLLFGNLLDFVSAERKTTTTKKREHESRNIQRS